MSEITAAYRSTDPEVVSAWKAAGDAIQEYVDQTRAILDAAGLGGYQVYRHHGWSPGKFAGLAIPVGEKPPAGWRMTARYAVPDKRVKAGKQIEAALAGVKHPGDPLLKLIGMPPDAESRGGFSSPAVRLLEERTALYVAWSVDPVGRQSFLGSRDRAGVIDPDRWERIPLSAYYLAVEQADAVKAGAA